MCAEADSRRENMVLKKEGNRVSIPGTVSVRLEEWEAVYIPVDVETNWFKSTRNTRKPVLVQMTATSCTYLPFSDNEAVTDIDGTSIITSFLENVNFGSARNFQF